MGVSWLGCVRVSGSCRRPWDVLLAASTRARRFSEDDVGFLQGVANVLAIARERGESQSRLQSILGHAPAVIYLMDVDGRFAVINDELEKIVGVPREQALGKPREQLLPGDVAAQHRANDLEVLREGRAIMHGRNHGSANRFSLADRRSKARGLRSRQHSSADPRSGRREDASTRCPQADPLGDDARALSRLDRPGQLEGLVRVLETRDLH